MPVVYTILLLLTLSKVWFGFRFLCTKLYHISYCAHIVSLFPNYILKLTVADGMGRDSPVQFIAVL